MKTWLLILFLVAGASTLFGQGALQWGNTFSGFRAPIYGGSVADTELSGQSDLGIPSGTTVYHGPLLQGTGWTFALFAGPAGSTSNQLAFVGGASQPFRTATGNVLPAGLVLGGTTTIPAVDAGQQATFQIRMWQNFPGVTDWSSALAFGALHAASAMVLSGPLGGIPSTGGSPFNTPTTTGWTSFTFPIPEPSPVVLIGMVTTVTMFWRRRRARS